MKRESEAAAKPLRRRFSAAFRRRVVEQTLAPGASVSAVALEHRLNTNLLFTWRRRHLEKSRGETPAPKMLPVMVAAADTMLAKAPPRSVAGAGVIEIELAVGRIRLKGAVDAESLRAVVDVLLRR